ncbi:hypothetical protein MPTK1_6g17050 [Marchantia polymorpha subsp. ruderalis]|uniref:Uncharacterized protein n=2 Tax=Marchantia polymorpha TaxID=3197 RepID=A0AAF6BSW8_MARPO|nr:hypothetical protein MARPO_0144s0010 [Marchantia polymorpha]BBN15102.1 hypothetical protein Mp_6g17050 [Marchantia polymorpha subsp. ruderalis]|eukprot:PTQ29291.1 hypothetical protein MARPO_0144s0010 [Marchantia polymorpha]
MHSFTHITEQVDRISSFPASPRLSACLQYIHCSQRKEPDYDEIRHSILRKRCMLFPKLWIYSSPYTCWLDIGPDMRDKNLSRKRFFQHHRGASNYWNVRCSSASLPPSALCDLFCSPSDSLPSWLGLASVRELPPRSASNLRAVGRIDLTYWSCREASAEGENSADGCGRQPANRFSKKKIASLFWNFVVRLVLLRPSIHNSGFPELPLIWDAVQRLMSCSMMSQICKGPEFFNRFPRP